MCACTAVEREVLVIERRRLRLCGCLKVCGQRGLVLCMNEVDPKAREVGIKVQK
jgi:hypothetical protein